MIILLTSNTNGGILQFTIQVLKTLSDIGVEAVSFIPENACFSVEPSLLGKIRFYHKPKTVNLFHKDIRHILKTLTNIKPDLIWYTDSSILVSQIGLLLPKKIKQIITLHDAQTFHLTYKTHFIHMLRKIYSIIILAFHARIIHHILLLSQNCYNLYTQHYPNHKCKTHLLALGAHVPNTNPKKPSEIPTSQQFHLFFGRLDKYKGIRILLEEFNSERNSCNKKLVIAGYGILTHEETRLAQSNSNIILIKRYISDSEMLWLFRHSVSVVLPYLEATQSGLIPIAYHFGVPVIVSDIEGLTQNVIDKKTGFICKYASDYLNFMKKTENKFIRSKMKDSIRGYYEKRYNWNNNVQQLLSELFPR
ncbi:MAG TPA: glycosyltransferase family 4 protein [Caldisericia bacterium]|nr:glycosyltransferase family 4 protein [Caldisericia bacterium]